MAVRYAETASHPVGMRGTVLSEAVWERFAEDPMLSHSAAFPLGRAGGSVDQGSPSDPMIRPWGLRGMRPARHQGDPLREAFSYDHDRQIAVSLGGQPLTMADPTVNKVTNLDGDEGPSEDFTYDYCPDFPQLAG